MLAVIWTLAMELINNCIKILFVSLFSVLLHFTHKLRELVLDGISLVI